MSNVNTGSLPTVGETFPKGLKLYENKPDGVVNVDDLLAGKKVILFGVPGAFTPGCSKTHLPGYIADSEKFKSKGVDEIVCVSVNDPFVMAAWGEQHHAAEKGVRMLADTKAEFVKSLGLGLDLTDALGGVRSKRFSIVVDNGVIKQVNVEPENDPTGLTCSLAAKIQL